MALEAQEIVVRAVLQGGAAMQAEADRMAATMEGLDAKVVEANRAAAASQGGLTGFLGKAGANATSLGNKLDQLSKKSLQFGRQTAVLSAGAGFLIYESLKVHAAEQSQRVLLETQAGATHMQADALERATKQWAKYGVSATEGLKAVYKVQSVFKAVPKDIEVMTAAMKGAAIGHVSVEEMSDAVTADVNLWKTRADKEAALLEKTAALGKMHLPELVQGLGTTTPALAHGIGINQEAMLGAIAGVSSVMPGTGPQSFINLMKTPLIKAAALKGQALEAAKRMGLQEFDMAHMLKSGPMGLVKMLQALNAGMAKVGPDQGVKNLSEMFGGSRGLGSLMTMLKALPSIERDTRALALTGTTELNKNFDKTSKTLAFQAKATKASISDLAGELGKVMEPMALEFLKDAVSVLKTMSSLFKELGKPEKDAVIGLVAFTALLAPLGFIFAGVFGVTGVAAKAIGWMFGRFMPSEAAKGAAKVNAVLAGESTAMQGVGTKWGTALRVGMVAAAIIAAPEIGGWLEKEVDKVFHIKPKSPTGKAVHRVKHNFFDPFGWTEGVGDIVHGLAEGEHNLAVKTAHALGIAHGESPMSGMHGGLGGRFGNLEVTIHTHINADGKSLAEVVSKHMPVLEKAQNEHRNRR